MAWMQSKLTFDEALHEYRWCGRKVPGVTEILSNVGTRGKDGFWKPVGFNDAFLSNDDASTFGQAFHKVALLILRGKIPEFPAAMEPWIKQFRSFLADWNIRPMCDREGNLLVEYPMYSQRYKYAGTLDIIAGFGKKHKIALLDWKTSTSRQAHWNLQTNAYTKLAEENLDILSLERITVIFSESRYDPAIRLRHPEDWSAFLSCLNVYNINK